MKPAAVLGVLALGVGVASANFLSEGTGKIGEVAQQNLAVSTLCGTVENPCWISANLNALQERVSQLNWSEAISAVAPLPFFSPINMSAAKRWIGSHCTEAAKRAAQWIIDHTNHIAHKTFEEGLAETVDDLNEELAKTPDQKYAAVVTEQGKSNRWVTGLALKYLKQLPTDVLTLGDRFLERIKGLNIRKIVLFDDAIYSGQQMNYLINSVLSKMIDLYNDFNFQIYLAVPFIGNKNRFMSLEKDCGQLKIVKNREIPLIRDFVGENKTFVSELCEFCDTFLYKEDGRTLTYFDHKIPDFVSLFCEHRLRYGTIGGESEGCNPYKINPIRFLREDPPVYKL